MTIPERRARIGVCETQPVTAVGVKHLISDTVDLEFAEYVSTLAEGARMLEDGLCDVLLVDKGFGVAPVLGLLSHLCSASIQGSVVLWGASVTEAEALRFVQEGARGILRKSASPSSLLNCLRSVAAGRNWMENNVFRDAVTPVRNSRTELTPREHQVLELVQHGYRNRDIASQLGIRPGTVKIHLKHIFEKTGVRGRYGLALSGLRERGIFCVDNGAEEQQAAAV
jgi:DNA-binding NarL/FixJ family response regulator